jgi:putative toxin-antitoxin system antitoxin component (TIGR02293 family)
MSQAVSVRLLKKRPGKTSVQNPNAPVNIVKESLDSTLPEIATVIRQIKRGYPIDKFERLKEEFGVNREKLAGIASISLATLHRRKVSAKHLTPEESEKIYLLERLYATALEVLEKKEVVRAWFNSPQIVFEGKTPLEYADTLPGSEEVERVLRRMEHGVLL